MSSFRVTTLLAECVGLAPSPPSAAKQCGPESRGGRTRTGQVMQFVMPNEAMVQYTVMLMIPTLVTMLTGIGCKTRPIFNVTNSNVR